MAEYQDYAKVFLLDLAMELPENTSINKYVNNLEDGKQLFYRLIYALSLVELETLKAYIKTHLKTGFIHSFKFLASALIFFNKKSNRSLQFDVDYQCLNKLIMKN